MDEDMDVVKEIITLQITIEPMVDSPKSYVRGRGANKLKRRSESNDDKDKIIKLDEIEVPSDGKASPGENSEPKPKLLLNRREDERQGQGV